VSRLAAELMEVLAGHLSPALVSPAALELLRGAAPFLPPVPRMGIECRLGAAGGPVDVSQHLRAREGGAAHLRALARDRADAAAPAAREAWARIGRFAQAWGAPGPLADGRVDEAWLEYDLETACGADTVPSVFTGFGAAAAEGGRGFAPVLALLAPDAGEAAAALRRALDEARRLGGRAHAVVGAMLARGDEVRCVVRGLSPAAAAAWLGRIGWPGPADEAAALLERFGPHASEAGVAMGFAPGPLPRLGIELLTGAERGKPDRLAGLLAALVQAGTCTPAAAGALLEWRGDVTPVTSRAPWPQALVAASLLAPADRWGVLSRFVNHVKLGVQAGRAVQAKAYLGCVQTWREQSRRAVVDDV
jgi:hypothetical protein